MDSISVVMPPPQPCPGGASTGKQEAVVGDWNWGQLAEGPHCGHFSSAPYCCANCPHRCQVLHTCEPWPGVRWSAALVPRHPSPAAVLYEMEALTVWWGSRSKPCCQCLRVATLEPPAWPSPGQTLTDGARCIPDISEAGCLHPPVWPCSGPSASTSVPLCSGSDHTWGASPSSP